MQRVLSIIQFSEADLLSVYVLQKKAFKLQSILGNVIVHKYCKTEVQEEQFIDEYAKDGGPEEV